MIYIFQTIDRTDRRANEGIGEPKGFLRSARNLILWHLPNRNRNDTYVITRVDTSITHTERDRERVRGQQREGDRASENPLLVT